MSRPGTHRGGSRLLPVLVVLGLSGLGGCGLIGSEDDDSVVVGRVYDDITGQSTVIRLPTGELTITVGQADDEAIQAEQAEDNTAHDPPSGGSFVPVQWSFDALAKVPGAAVIAQDPLPASATMTVGGTTVALPEPYLVRGVAIASSPVEVFYVPSDDKTPSPVVDVDYDGLTQSLDASTGKLDSGVAEALYGDASDAPDVPCEALPSSTRAGLTVEISCKASVETVPYLPGVGWADGGTAYPVVGYRLQLTSARTPETSWQSEGSAVEATVLGKPSIQPVRVTFGAAAPADEASAIEVFAAQASGGEALVAGTFTVKALDGGDESAEVDVSATIPLP